MSQPTAIITGAGSGIGRATAMELRDRGYRLTLCGRRLDPLREIAESIDGVLAVPADITKPSDVDLVIAQTLDRFGRIDAIVNNAGFAPQRDIWQMSIEEWRQVIDTNLSAVFYFCKAVWPIFKLQGGGAIVNLSSMATRDPFAGLGAYAAAKAGVNLLSLALAREGEEIGVRVYTIAPGAVETPMFRTIRTTQQFPTEKTLAPAEVARVIAQCIAGDLKYCSGEVIWLHRTPA